MNDYPMLHFLMRWGKLAAACLALAVLAAGLWAGPSSGQWLRPGAARISRVRIHGKSRWVLAPARTLSAGLDWKGRGPDVVLQALGAHLKRRGGEIMLATRARALRMEHARCVGVSAEQG